MSIAEKIEVIADEVYVKGLDAGRDEGYEAGKQEMNEDMWVAITGNYTRTDYGYAFQYSDMSNVVAPEKAINATTIGYAFRYYLGESIPKIFDCSALSNLTEGMTHSFRYASKLKVFPDFNIPAVVNAYKGTWQFCRTLETIEMIRCNENTIFDATFDGCVSLKNITFEGVIGTNISFGSCVVLTKETLLSNGDGGVFAKLKDYAATGTTHTITLHSDTKALLTDAEKAIATQKGWTIA